MSLLIRLFLLFTIIPLVELIVLLKINSWLGLGATVLLVLGTGALGAALAKYQGWVTWNRIRQDLAMGIMPSGRLIDGALILAAGILLITPGLLTDLCGFAFLIPPVRDRIKRSIRNWFQDRIASGDYRVHWGPF